MQTTKDQLVARIERLRPGKALRLQAAAPWVTGGIAAVLIFIAMFLHRFLAVNDPVGEGVLVVEAWIPEQTLSDPQRSSIQDLIDILSSWVAQPRRMANPIAPRVMLT
jgi:hypothetical protein